MTKVRKIRVGDYVTFGRHEWIVQERKTGKYKLVRRQVLTGPSVWVHKRKVKLADQSWRNELKTGDTLTFFISGKWTPAIVIRRVGEHVFVQPSFTNYTEQIHHHSSRIAYMQHNFPPWAEESIHEVLYMGQVRAQRGNGLMFPWEYGETDVIVAPQKPKFIKRLTFKMDKISPGRYPFEFYSRLSNEEIIHDLMMYSRAQHHLVFRLVLQYAQVRELKYPLCNGDNCVQYFIESALANDDHRRVNELLTIGNNQEIFLTNEWAVQEKVSHPFFDLNFEVTDNCVHIDLLWYRRRRRTRPESIISQILMHISTELKYKPQPCPSSCLNDLPPEQSYILSRMLGMEEEPLESLYLRRVTDSCWLTLHGGFCEPVYEHFGGVVSSYGCDFVELVQNLVRISPLKTLVIVQAETISNWSGFANWHKNRRERQESIVVTTKNTFTRTWTELVGFQRLVCLALPKSACSVYARALVSISCKTRWAMFNSVCEPKTVTSAFRVLGCPPDFKAMIHADRLTLEQHGTLFPIITKKVIPCQPYQFKNLLVNLEGQPEHRVLDYVSKYLLHTSLVPKHLSGTKLEYCEGTLNKICSDFKVNKKGEERLENQLKENCPVCMTQMTDSMITSCGHAFCPSCVSELKTRHLNCPLCRSKIDGYIKVSDKNTDGQLVMHKGTCYRVNSEDKWGAKHEYLKMNKKGATIVTRYPTVKNKLRKEFPDCEILTKSAVKHGVRISNNKIIFVEPMDRGFERFLVRAWGEDLDITSLSYKIDI